MVEWRIKLWIDFCYSPNIFNNSGKGYCPNSTTVNQGHTLCSAVCQCHNMQCELLYNIQCAINNVESSSAMTSDEGWLHDWGSTAAFNQVSPSTQLGCWNTQMSPTTNVQYLHQDQISKMGPKSEKSSHRGPLPSTDFHPYLPLTVETLKCRQSFTNVTVPSSWNTDHC